MDKIGLPEQGKITVEQYEMEEAEYRKWKELFYSEPAHFFHEVRKREDKELALLYLYVSFAAELHEDYVKRKISDEIYFDTFSDISIWDKSCLRIKRLPGLIEEEWLARHLNMRLFRLGRLQYEIEGDVLHIHIPEGGPLLEEECDRSLKKAEQFFGGKYRIYDCESWLLDPALNKLLGPGSNIIKFQKRFQIDKVIYEIPQAEERIFGSVLERKEDYPEGTALQRKMKQYLLSGGKIGLGYGVLIRRP